MKTIYWVAAAAALTGCGKTYAEIVAKRPKPLRDQPMPATAQERTAKTAAQLGRYEAKGGWADDVQAIVDRCHSAGA